MGRSAVVGGNTFQVLIDTEPYDPQVTYDNYGGYWIEIPYDLQENSEVLLRIAVEDERAGLYREQSEDLQRWLSPSELIDSDNPALTAEAEKLTVDSTSAIEKARRIQRFVIGHLEFTNYINHFRDKASDTYEMGYGTCVNHARLFVALCRAANVPARTVWGIIYNNGVYDTTDRAYDGRLGFKLVDDNFPNSLVVENRFVLADVPSLVPQKVP